MDENLNCCSIATRAFLLVLTVCACTWSRPCVARPLTKSLCNPDNETFSEQTIFTRAAARAHTDDLGVRVPDSWFRGSLNTVAATIHYGGEQRKWVMMTMADKKVAQKILPLTLRALSRLPLDHGLDDIGAQLLLPPPHKEAALGGATSTTAAEGATASDPSRAGSSRRRRSAASVFSSFFSSASSSAPASSFPPPSFQALSSAASSAPSDPDRPTDRDLSSLMVVMTWDGEAQAACRELQEQGYGHECVQEPLHELHHSNASSHLSAFHSPEFNALGFAKVKYLYNALSLGYDVITMDADVVVLQSPLPFVLQQRAHLAALTERCEVVDPFMQLQLGTARHPNQNIGVMAARSEGPVLRCVERWFGSLVAHVDNPRLWDQEEFNRVTALCAPAVGLRWHSLDNRRFVSLCYPRCGCDYGDEERALLTDPAMRRKHFEWSFRKGRPYDDPKKRTCGPSAWADWILAHFPCQGSLRDKATNMGQLLEGYLQGEARVIKNTDKVP